MSNIAELKWYKALRRAKVPLSGQEIYSTVIPMWILDSPTCNKEVVAKSHAVPTGVPARISLHPVFDEGITIGVFTSKRQMQDFCEANSLVLVEKEKK